MVTIICATHRPQNQTQKVVKAYGKMLESKGVEHQLFTLEELPRAFFEGVPFSGVGSELQDLLDRVIAPSEKLVVISPEYNGSFPGIFKSFLDSVPPVIWRGKKAALVGVASGRAGNIRGMDHLTDVFHHLQIEVLSAKVPISKIEALLSDAGELHDVETLAVLERQWKAFEKF